MSERTKDWTRRSVVKGGIAVAAAPALYAVPAQAQNRVVKIGHVSPNTGQHGNRYSRSNVVPRR
jgi:hypothetical protein